MKKITINFHAIALFWGELLYITFPKFRQWLGITIKFAAVWYLPDIQRSPPVAWRCRFDIVT